MQKCSYLRSFRIIYSSLIKLAEEISRWISKIVIANEFADATVLLGHVDYFVYLLNISLGAFNGFFCLKRFETLNLILQNMILKFSGIRIIEGLRTRLNVLHMTLMEMKDLRRDVRIVHDTNGNVCDMKSPMLKE